MSEENNFADKYKTWHQKISYLKSGVRLIGCGLAVVLAFQPVAAIIVFAFAFAVAEALGIVEEWI